MERSNKWAGAFKSALLAFVVMFVVEAVSIRYFGQSIDFAVAAITGFVVGNFVGFLDGRR